MLDSWGILKGTSSSLEMCTRIKREDEELQSEEPGEEIEQFYKSYLKSSKICTC